MQKIDKLMKEVDAFWDRIAQDHGEYELSLVVSRVMERHIQSQLSSGSPEDSRVIDNPPADSGPGSPVSGDSEGGSN